MGIKPLEDWICAERLEYKHKSLYVHGQKTHRAKIVAVGPGKRLRRWVEVQDPFNGKRFRAQVGDQTGKIKPTSVVPGEVVEISEKGYEEHRIDGKDYIFFREPSIIGYADLSDTEGLQSHNSAIIPAQHA